MAPLISLSGNDIVEASLLETAGEECGTSPMPEEEVLLLDEEIELPEAPEAAAFLPECPAIPDPMESTEQINSPSTSAPPSPMPKPSHYPSRKTKKSWQGTEANPTFTTELIWFYVEKNERVPDWWREFQSIHHSKDEHFNDDQVK